MPLDKSRVESSLQQWLQAVQGFTLPRWEDMPALPLYMDQVIMLLNDYLYPGKTAAQDITPAMIHNYVKLKIVPSPVKKRYTRVHLAYLIMVCILKQTLSISAIPALLPPQMAEEDVQTLYNAFADIHKDAADQYVRHIESLTKSTLQDHDHAATHLVMRLAVVANLSSLLTAQLSAVDEEPQQ